MIFSVFAKILKMMLTEIHGENKLKGAKVLWKTFLELICEKRVSLHYTPLSLMKISPEKALRSYMSHFTTICIERRK